MEDIKMEKTEFDKNDYSKYQYGYNGEVSRSDLFLAKDYEELFYMTPKELAIAINSMNEDELLQFNQAISNGHGMNADLMIEKLDELSKYFNVNVVIFGEAIMRTSVLDALISISNVDKEKYKEIFCKSLREIKEFFTGKDKNPQEMNLYDILFIIYPTFKEHFHKLEKAGVIEKTDSGLKWNRDQIALIEYFNCLECMDRRRKWIFIEKIFGYKNLCQYLNTHKERQNKPSKHFDEIKELLDLK
jgi:hypothetical protein